MARTYVRGETQIMAGTIFNEQIAASAAISLAKVEDGTQLIKADGTVAFTANVDLGGFEITNAAVGTGDSSLVTKAQLDAVSAGLDPKESVRAASTANIDLATGTLLTIDGVALADGDRVLVKDQTDPTENGIYTAAAGAWARAADFDGNPGNEVSGGAYCFVVEGTANAASGWIVVANGDIVVDTDNIVFTQFNAASTYTGGNGISVSGSVITADVDGTTITNLGGTGAQIGIVAGGVGTTQLADLAVTTAKLADDAVTTIKITDLNVTTAKIADLAITEGKIADLAVGTAKIADLAVTTAKIADSAITTIKIADANVTTAKLADDSVTAAKINADVAGSGLVANGTTGALDVNVDGTTLAITADVVGIADAGVDTTQLADNAVTTIKIADTAVTTAKLADNAVTTIKIANAAVTLAKLADDSVDETKIVSTALGTYIIGGSGTVIDIDTSLVSTFAGWTKYSWPTEAVATNTLTYTFNGGNPIVANTFELYLNGVLLEPDAGVPGANDYAFNATTGVVTFPSAGDAPRNNDKLYAHYVDVP